MRKHNLNKTGLSMSQAQSISNLCNQRVQEINNKIAIINNTEKTLVIGDQTYVETTGVPMPEDIVDLITQKGRLHACQGFLMENIKAKEALLKAEKDSVYIPKEGFPKQPLFENPTILPAVNETWGWEQLSNAELNEYIEAEAHAAHIGQFIHKDSKLDYLRKELSTIKTLEWISIEDGKKIPLKVKVLHTSEQLLKVHESLAALHRGYEQRVNYFKAKVKNLVSDENARISKENANSQDKVNLVNKGLLNEYQVAASIWESENLALKHTFESNKETQLKEISALRIEVDGRFQKVINEFLNSLGGE